VLVLGGIKNNEKVLLNIKSDFNIYKIGNRVFQISEIDFDFNFISQLVSILDLGLKFVPTYIFNYFQLFSFLKSIELELVNFNKKLSLRMWSWSRESNLNNGNSTSETLSLNDEYNIDLEENENFKIDFKYIFKKFNKQKNPFNFKNKQESIEFKYSFFDYLTNVNFANNPVTHGSALP
jgi:hypothetical protein